jgi:hypothetical protein
MLAKQIMSRAMLVKRRLAIWTGVLWRRRHGGKRLGRGKSGVEGIVERLEGVDVFEGERGRSPRTLRRKTSRTSSKSPRKMSPRKSSPEKPSRRFEPYPS